MFMIHVAQFHVISICTGSALAVMLVASIMIVFGLRSVAWSPVHVTSHDLNPGALDTVLLALA